jgi:hypothetical protein
LNIADWFFAARHCREPFPSIVTSNKWKYQSWRGVKVLQQDVMTEYKNRFSTEMNKRWEDTVHANIIILCLERYNETFNDFYNSCLQIPDISNQDQSYM